MKHIQKPLPIIIAISLLFSLAGFASSAFSTVIASSATNSPQAVPVTLSVGSGGVTTVDKQVEASSDDCYTFGHIIRLTRDCLFIDNGSFYMHTYLKFTDVNVPQGATIEHAYIDLCSDAYHGGNSYLRIYGIKEANTDTFSTQADADSRLVTNAYVDWIMYYYDNGVWTRGAWYGWTNDPHDLKDVIQEIVDQDGWQADNALAIRIVNTRHQSNSRCVYSWDSDHSLAPKLHIEYSSDLNRAPVLGPIGDKSTDGGNLLQFAIFASDPDGSSLTYSASNLPEGADFANQTFSWTPDYHQAGVYEGVHFQVSDGELTDSEDVTIVVNNVNLIPAAVVDSINPNPEAIEGDVISFSGHGEDSDGSIVAYDWNSNIDGFLSNSSSLSTSSLSAGTHTISFKVKDNDDAWSEQVETLLTITSPSPPAIAFSPENFNFAAAEGGSDPADQTLGIYNSGDGTLNWSISDDAGWLSLTPTSGSSTGDTDSIALSVDTTGLSANTYTATIIITAPGAANSPQTMHVTLTVKPGGVVTVDKQVQASSDDCYTFTTRMRLTRNWLFIDECSNYMHTYLRFTDVNIPPGASIEHAYVDLYSGARQGGRSYLRIYGMKEANTNTFSTQADADGRPVTNAYVKWTMDGLYQNQTWLPGTWYGWTNDPHDIKDVIQEIVGQDGWQANNALGIKIVSTPLGGNARCAYSWDYGNHSLAPKLHIEYSVGADAT